MTKSKSSASSIVVPSIFVTHFVSAQYLNETCVAGAAVTVMSPLTSKHRCNHKD